MRFNWAMGISVMYVGFALAMVGLVLFSTTQRVDLVAPNYYENEIKYENHIATVKRTQALSEKPTWRISMDRIEFLFPVSWNDSDISGSFKFYRPSNSGADFNVTIKPLQHSQQLSIDKLARGMWKLQITWKVKEIEFYDETVFFKE